MNIGLKGEKIITVTENQLAKNVGSGVVDVFATPMMIANMEGLSAETVKPYLDDGMDTVGILVNVDHIAATPCGMKVRFECELIEVEGKKLTFQVAAFDEKEKIGSGTHVRVIVNVDKFNSRAINK